MVAPYIGLTTPVCFKLSVWPRLPRAFMDLYPCVCVAVKRGIRNHIEPLAKPSMQHPYNSRGTLG
jgi:hypothetical protein